MRLQRKLKYIQIIPHVLFRTGTGQRYDTGLSEIAKKDLCRTLVILLGEVTKGSTGENMLVRRQAPETLENDPMTRLAGW